MTVSLPSARDRRRLIRDSVLRRRISEPLRSKLASPDDPGNPNVGESGTYSVILELNLNYPGGQRKAREAIRRLLVQVIGDEHALSAALFRNSDDVSHPYVFARLTGSQLKAVVNRDGTRASSFHARISQKGSADLENSDLDPSEGMAGQHVPEQSRAAAPAIFRVWESQKVHPLTTESIRAVKADAAHNAFGAFGTGVIWAVLDSGVDAQHPHFCLHKNLDLPQPLTQAARSFTDPVLPWNEDAFGHGTHVAGIIAGQAQSDSQPQAAIQSPAGSSEDAFELQDVSGIKGMAPKAKLLILRVLDDNGDGDEIALIQAIEYIQQLNDYGRHLAVHGVNISAGFPAHPTWYACGQTPLCQEINRLVRSGVLVVVAAGNSGHVITFLDATSTTEAGQLLSINDPGNAELALTVGSTHREAPHTFGVSYFSSKGPTSDGRRKPELVAPGEKIISAASSQRASKESLPGLNGAAFTYIEDTGTSMAAPHVSGVLASFLSIRREFQGQPEKVCALATASAMDLGRDPNFQGAGLIDLMKLIQSV